MKAEDYYRQIAIELDSGRRDSATWARALAESGGEADKTKALYIRYRFTELGKQHPAAALADGDSELQRLRADLRRRLALQRKESLYSVIGVPADASDATIADAIRRLPALSSLQDAETRYALEVLGDAATRETYDRRLMEQVRERQPAANVVFVSEPKPATGFMDGPMKALSLSLLVLGIGYLGLDYSREKTARELRIKELALRETEVKRAAEIAERAAENQKSSAEASAAAQERAAEARERAQVEARMREDKQRLDQAFRQEQQTAQAEQRRQQAEQSRLQAETSRRNAEAANANRVLRQQAIQDAIARGNHNEAQRLRNMAY